MKNKNNCIEKLVNKTNELHNIFSDLDLNAENIEIKVLESKLQDMMDLINEIKSIIKNPYTLEAVDEECSKSSQNYTKKEDTDNKIKMKVPQLLSELVGEYGEYGIPFEIACQCSEYKFKNTCEDKSKGETYKFGVKAKLDIKHLLIEYICDNLKHNNSLNFNIYMEAERNGTLGWYYSGISSIHTDTIKGHKESLDNLSETMYNVLIEYAKKKSLTWSKLNTIVNNKKQKNKS